jgi:hypothetical protein
MSMLGRMKLANGSLVPDQRRWIASATLATVLIMSFDCGSRGSGTPDPAGTGGKGPPVGGTGGGMPSTGTAGRGGPGRGGMPGHMGAGGVSAGTATGGVVGTGGSIAVSRGGASGTLACVPGVQQAIITDCGYPSTGSALSSTVFNESEVLRAIVPSGSWPTGTISVFYNDEHALTLGVRSVVVKSASGTTTTDYPVTALPAVPGSALAPQTGTNVLAGDQSGLDTSLRPMWPSLFITDVSANPTSRAGDWQQGGRPRAPDAVFGTWKAAVRTVDTTVTPNLVTITPDADPAKNKWDLGTGGPVPAGLASEGFGAEARWNVALVPGHSYRIQVLVHDGDQNKVGGDSGEACVLFCAGGSCSECGSDGSGGSGGTSCPVGLTVCGQEGTPDPCTNGTVCANGCCLIPI